jgi:hypothetical protein
MTTTAALAVDGLVTRSPELGAPRLKTIKRSSFVKQAYRKRKDAGGRVPRIPLADYHGTVALALDLGWLLEKHSRNRRHVAGSFGRMMDELTKWANQMRDRHGPQWTDQIEFPGFNPEHD